MKWTAYNELHCLFAPWNALTTYNEPYVPNIRKYYISKF